MLGYSLSILTKQHARHAGICVVRMQAVDIMAQVFQLVVDKRERHLLALFGDGGVQTETLELGDVWCRYEDGSCWVAERKTTQDLANSIKDGRWDEQRTRLASSGLHVFYILEGDFKAVRGLPYGAIVGAYSNLLLHQGIATVIRTADIFETKFVLTQLASKCQGVAKPMPLGVVSSKRKKEDDTRNIWIRQLACIPTISEHIAATILDHFGSMSALREALRSPETFPVVHLSRSACVGKKRVAKLATVLLT